MFWYYTGTDGSADKITDQFLFFNFSTFQFPALVAFPPCKINLGLSVISKRADGYHDLETCFYPIPWLDILEIIPADAFSFDSTGDLIPGSADQNLCVKAYHLLKKDFDLPPTKIHLHKIIPSRAGLGGGSSDAAYTLRLLNTIFALQISQDTLLQYASQLGSDCAFFVQDKAMVGTGRGEILSEINFSLQGRFIVVVKPDIHVSTADAFAGITPRVQPRSIREIVSSDPVDQWRGVLKNDFEDTVFKKYPVLQVIQEKLYLRGAQYASMSGTGSSLFGIFAKPVDLDQDFAGMRYWTGVMS